MAETRYKYLNTAEPIVNIDLIDLYDELTRAAASNKEVQINAAVLSTIGSVKTNKYKEDSNLLCIQKFCNACLLEHLFIAENSNLKFRTDDHDTIVPNSQGIDVSDFEFTSKLFYSRSNNNKFKAELKIVAERPNQKMEHKSIHDAEIIIYYHIFSKQYYTFIKNLETNTFVLCPGAIPELNYPKNFVFLKLISDMRSNLIAVRTITHAVKDINFMDNQTYIDLLSKINSSVKDNPYSLENGYDPTNGSNTDYGFDEPDYNESFNSNEYLDEAFGSAYSNKLDLTKALQNKDYCVSLVKDFYGYDGPIETGGFYILPDGTAIKSANHMDIDNLLIRYHYINRLDREPMQYGDGSQFMDAINCVRIRRRGGRDAWILPYMILPEKQLTAAQYNVIENWIKFVLEKSHELSVQTLDNQSKVFKASQYNYFDVIDAIKLYYRAHILEDLREDYEIIFEEE